MNPIIRKINTVLKSKGLPDIDTTTLEFINGSDFKIANRRLPVRRKTPSFLHHLHWRDLTWQARKDLPLAKDNFGCVCLNNRIYAIGGRTTDIDSESLFQHEESLVHVYDAQSNVWSTKRGMPFPHAGNAAAVAANGNIFSVGGYLKIPDTITPDDLPFYHSIGSVGYMSNMVQAYNPSTDTWSRKSPMLSNRVFPAAVATADGYIYVIGGYQWVFTWPDPANPSQPPAEIIKSKEVLKYHVQSDSWTKVAAKPSGASGPAAVVGKDGLIYVMGGLNEDCQWGSTVEAYNPVTDTWTKKSDMPTPRGALSAVVDTDGKIYVTGGVTEWDSIDTVEIYDPASDSWTIGPQLPGSRMAHGSVITGDGTIFILGGLQVDMDAEKELLLSSMISGSP